MIYSTLKSENFQKIFFFNVQNWFFKCKLKTISYSHWILKLQLVVYTLAGKIPKSRLHSKKSNPLFISIVLLESLSNKLSNELMWVLWKLMIFGFHQFFLKISQNIDLFLWTDAYQKIQILDKWSWVHFLEFFMLFKKK